MVYHTQKITNIQTPSSGSVRFGIYFIFECHLPSLPPILYASVVETTCSSLTYSAVICESLHRCSLCPESLHWSPVSVYLTILSLKAISLFAHKSSPPCSLPPDWVSHLSFVLAKPPHFPPSSIIFHFLVFLILGVPCGSWLIDHTWNRLLVLTQSLA